MEGHHFGHNVALAHGFGFLVTVDVPEADESVVASGNEIAFRRE